jgi:hypothetical protein
MHAYELVLVVALLSELSTILQRSKTIHFVPKHMFTHVDTRLSNNQTLSHRLRGSNQLASRHQQQHCSELRTKFVRHICQLPGVYRE